jgi:hypothetical protein
VRDKTLWSSLAAILSVVAASSCCLPIIPLWLAASSAGASMFLAAARPYLMTLSVLLIAYGFWTASRATQCTRGRRTINFTLLAVSALFVGASLLFPQVLANWLAG